MKIRLILVLIVFTFASEIFAQNIPIGFPLINEYLRREQVLGNLASDFSFNVRPINAESAFPTFQSPFLNDSSKIHPIKSKSEKFKLSVLPVQLTTIYNSTLPDGWTNGVLIPAKGLQTLLSAGIHMKLGKLTIQLYPQYHYAQNLAFEEYPEDASTEYFDFLRRSVLYIDSPVRYGDSPISNFSMGNSHIMMNFDGISFGLSTENLWSGPGQFNSLVLSDNAPGFNHFRVQTTRPLKTFLGSFEGNYWIGQLKGSKYTYFSDGAYNELFRGQKNSDWRYFTGITISYAPKWIPGLSFGLTRGFQIYRDDMENNFRAYFPLFAPFQKQNEGLIESRNKREDQNVSVFTRWVFPKVQSEFYFEYSRNDHPLNWRDLILNTEHSRAYQLGFSKFINLPNSYRLGIHGEITQTQMSINNIIRWPNYLGSSNSGLGSYDNFQVTHGWTNKGQVLGANNGISGNSYTMKVGLYSGFKEISLKFEHLANNPNFYQLANTAGLNVNPWIDYSASLGYSNSIKNLLFESSITSMVINNYNHWNSSDKITFSENSSKKFNLSLQIKLAYLL